MTTSTIRTEPEIPAAESPAVRDVYSSPNSKPTAVNQSSTSANSKQPRGLQFWATILGLSLVGFLPALESTVVSTALPTISADLQGGRTFVWVVNEYFLSCTAFQPLVAQLSDILGRRMVLSASMLLMVLGSAISGGANSPAMLIGGRTIQGIGGGGCLMMPDIVVCDLVPLRERSTIMSIVYSTSIVGSVLGPVIGGLLVDRSTWRWVFLINIPVAAASLLILGFFYKPKPRPETSWKEKLAQIDIIGNLIFIPSVVAILIALADADAVFPWSSWRTIFSLILGFGGLAAFLAYEWSPYCQAPMVPFQLFSNRTSAVVFVLSFFHFMLLNWEIFVLPLYFQGVQSSSPTRSGIQLLPTVVPLMLAAMIGGITLENTGRYKPTHLASFALTSLAVGLFTLLSTGSTTAKWVVFQLIFSVGSGLMIPVQLPAAQAGLPESAAALSTGFWAFCRSFGTVWAFAIPSTIFNARVAASRGRLPDHVGEFLVTGNAYQSATKVFLDSLSLADSDTVRQVFSDSLTVVWFAALALSMLCFLLVFIEKQLELRTELETEFGVANHDPGPRRVAVEDTKESSS